MNKSSLELSKKSETVDFEGGSGVTDQLMPPSAINDDRLVGDDSQYTSELGPVQAFLELKQKSGLNVNRNMYLMAQRVSFVTLVEQTNLKKMRQVEKKRKTVTDTDDINLERNDSLKVSKDGARDMSKSVR